VPFADDVRAELNEALPPAAHCRLAQLSGVVRFSGSFHLRGRGEVHVRCDLGSSGTVRRAMELLRERGATCEVRTYQERRFQRHTRFLLIVRGDPRSLQVLHEAGVLSASLTPLEEVPHRVVARSCCRRAYLRGAFLAAGSVSGLRAAAHLEIRASSRQAAEQLAELAGREGFPLAVHEARRYWIAYTKRSETIRDLLAALGAHGAELRHEEQAVMRWARERANRLTNADAANLRRQTDAAARQRAAIEALGLDDLPADLRVVAELRLRHPEATLAELGELATPPLSKAAVAGRLRRLVERADLAAEDPRRNHASARRSPERGGRDAAANGV
jgi:DNA-binding protein WhiA